MDIKIGLEGSDVLVPRSNMIKIGSGQGFSHGMVTLCSKPWLFILYLNYSKRKLQIVLFGIHIRSFFNNWIYSVFSNIFSKSKYISIWSKFTIWLLLQATTTGGANCSGGGANCPGGTPNCSVGTPGCSQVLITLPTLKISWVILDHPGDILSHPGVILE